MAPLARSSYGARSSKRVRTSRKLSQKPKRAMAMYPAIQRNLTYGGPFPPVKKCTVVYSTVVASSVATGNGSYVFSANGLYDPDITGTGTQPLYFDQLMALYNHYVVTSSTITVEALNDGSDRSLVLTCYPDDDTTIAGNFTAMQRPGAVVKSGNPLNQAVIIKNYWSAYKHFGPGVLNNSLFRGDTTRNPDEQMYFAIQLQELGLASFSQNLRVTIRYSTTFSELKTVTAS